jgi:hypothetical protein
MLCHPSAHYISEARRHIEYIIASAWVFQKLAEDSPDVAFPISAAFAPQRRNPKH